ncbi:MAG: hypothetical protein V7636_2001 [Actinomycetota bacterium]
MASSVRVPISFDRLYVPLAVTLRAGPEQSFVTVDGDHVDVKMGWAFHARFERSRVTKTSIDMEPAMSRGAHGRGGRWLVNGAGPPFVVLTIEPPARARVLVANVRLSELVVSVEDPDELIAAIEGRS